MLFLLLRRAASHVQAAKSIDKKPGQPELGVTREKYDGLKRSPQDHKDEHNTEMTAKIFSNRNLRRIEYLKCRKTQLFSNQGKLKGLHSK